ncbi:MAG: efflux RND transporter periplasmic adaptor subunit [Marinicella sp.]|nr:efflux RND transporter periplasmic adaptor subunit [Xanthomonadales bacterium]
MNLKNITLLIISIAISACSVGSEEIDNDNTPDSYQSAVFSPEAQYKTHQVAAFVEPTDQANLSFQVSGVIEKQLVAIGEQVDSGQELFKISNPSLEPQIQQFQSQIEAIEATLQQNNAEVNRVQDLKRTNAISQNELDRLTHQRENLLATKKSVEAQLEQAQSLYDETYLKAPFAGSVAEIFKEAGEVISPGEVVMLLGGVSSLEAPLFLPSFLHQNISFGQQLTVSYQDHEMFATVTEISLSANPKSQLFKVMIEVPIEHGIKSGEKITVIIKELMGDYYRLPIESVIDDGINQPFVFLIDNGQVIQARIKLIDIEDDEIIVELPHQGKIEVVTQGQVKLSPGQKLG